VKPSDIVTIVLLVLFFAFCGWLCVFKTDMLVKWARDNYAKSRFFQRYPFSNVVQKPWYPAYIRGAGIFIWLWALGFVIFVIFASTHRRH
jgi:hypothetical protein